jgi:hypothetical protein
MADVRQDRGRPDIAQTGVAITWRDIEKSVGDNLNALNGMCFRNLANTFLSEKPRCCSERRHKTDDEPRIWLSNLESHQKPQPTCLIRSDLDIVDMEV